MKFNVKSVINNQKRKKMSRINYKMLAVAFSLCTATLMNKTSAQTWNCGDQITNVTATLSNDTLTIRENGAMADYLPNTLPWFANTSQINTIIIENGVTYLGYTAFYNCINATNVNIPNSVITIGKGAFCNCRNLTTISIPNLVITIRE